jgi:hypothetical protein
MFSFYSGLEDKISITDWIAQRSILHEQAFKRVKLLKGALELVKGLNDAEVPIAIATGSNNANFRWKTVCPVLHWWSWLMDRITCQSYLGCFRQRGFSLPIRTWGKVNLLLISTSLRLVD